MIIKARARSVTSSSSSSLFWLYLLARTEKKREKLARLEVALEVAITFYILETLQKQLIIQISCWNCSSLNIVGQLARDCVSSAGQLLAESSKWRLFTPT